MRKQNVFKIDMNLKTARDSNLTFVVANNINICHSTVKGKSVDRDLCPKS